MMNEDQHELFDSVQKFFDEISEKKIEPNVWTIELLNKLNK